MRLALPLLLVGFVVVVYALTPQQRCSSCRDVVYTTKAGFFGNNFSKRRFFRKIISVCKRHYNYRQRCLRMCAKNLEVIYNDSLSGIVDNYETCVKLHECDVVPQSNGTVSTVAEEFSPLPFTTTDHSTPPSTPTVLSTTPEDEDD